MYCIIGNTYLSEERERAREREREREDTISEKKKHGSAVLRAFPLEIQEGNLTAQPSHLCNFCSKHSSGPLRFSSLCRMLRLRPSFLCLQPLIRSSQSVYLCMQECSSLLRLPLLLHPPVQRNVLTRERVDARALCSRVLKNLSNALMRTPSIVSSVSIVKPLTEAEFWRSSCSSYRYRCLGSLFIFGDQHDRITSLLLLLRYE